MPDEVPVSAAKQDIAVWPGPLDRELSAAEKPPRDGRWKPYYCGEPEDKIGAAASRSTR